jgi:hypothetical protein
MKWTRLSAPLLGAAGLAFLAGCGPSTGHLAGAVTFAGQPVTQGQVTVYGPDGEVLTVTISPDGTYRVENVPAGQVRIVVLPPPPADPEGNEIVKVRAKEGKAAPIAPRAVKTPIPARYEDPGTSGLATTVKGGENKYDLVLTP